MEYHKRIKQASQINRLNHITLNRCDAIYPLEKKSFPLIIRFRHCRDLNIITMTIIIIIWAKLWITQWFGPISANKINLVDRHKQWDKVIRWGEERFPWIDSKRIESIVNKLDGKVNFCAKSSKLVDITKYLSIGCVPIRIQSYSPNDIIYISFIINCNSHAIAIFLLL